MQSQNLRTKRFLFMENQTKVKTVILILFTTIPFIAFSKMPVRVKGSTQSEIRQIRTGSENVGFGYQNTSMGYLALSENTGTSTGIGYLTGREPVSDSTPTLGSGVVGVNNIFGAEAAGLIPQEPKLDFIDRFEVKIRSLIEFANNYRHYYICFAFICGVFYLVYLAAPTSEKD